MSRVARRRIDREHERPVWPPGVAIRGVDTHKHVHVAAACDPLGRVLGTAYRTSAAPRNCLLPAAASRWKGGPKAHPVGTRSALLPAGAAGTMSDAGERLQIARRQVIIGIWKLPRPQGAHKRSNFSHRSPSLANAKSAGQRPGKRNRRCSKERQLRAFNTRVEGSIPSGPTTWGFVLKSAFRS